MTTDYDLIAPQPAFFINLKRAVIGPSATLAGRYNSPLQIYVECLLEWSDAIVKNRIHMRKVNVKLKNNRYNICWGEGLVWPICNLLFINHDSSYYIWAIWWETSRRIKLPVRMPGLLARLHVQFFGWRFPLVYRLRLRACADWPGPLLFAYTIMALFPWHGLCN